MHWEIQPSQLEGYENLETGPRVKYCGKVHGYNSLKKLTISCAFSSATGFVCFVFFWGGEVVIMFIKLVTFRGGRIQRRENFSLM